ncbi:MAG: ATP-grasp domain-containing protein [Bryobacteraceae bacterium]|nr:ATP-grasp domain-containing protein [Bryobacteraceae bacterium]
MPLTLLALASYEKGHAFLREAKEQGARVLLLTSESLRDSAKWPTDSIDEIYYMPDVDKKWNRQHTLNTIAYLARTEEIDRLVPLDDFDLEMAAFLREHLRIPGMGETTTRHFRDKLAMRMKADTASLNIPRFVHVLNHRRVQEFTEQVPAPWVLKPRFLAGAIGIHKVHTADELWGHIHRLGDEQSYYLVEQFVPGDICHVDSIVDHDQILFAIASRYGRPPLDVSQGGGIFTTRILERGSPLSQGLLRKNQAVLAALGLKRGVSHTEFIVAHADGKIYFLETSARVGGAHITDLVEAATGLNLWAEWAKLELAGGQTAYRVPPARTDYAGLLVSLARQERPDTSHYQDPEIAWRMDKKHHVGFIVKSPSYERVTTLLDDYAARAKEEFNAFMPAKDSPVD